MRELKGKQVILQDHDLKRREEANRRYLMKLTNDNLLFNYKVEAGRYDGRDIPADAHGGGRRRSARSVDISWDTGCLRQRSGIMRPGIWKSR